MVNTMEQKELMDAINNIREKSEKGKLIIFVGAGVSYNVDGMPSWEELVKTMAKAVGYSKCDQCKKAKKDCQLSCLLKESYSTDEYLKIPQYLYNLDKKKYYEIFKNNFKEIDVDAPLSKAIFELNPAHIITTNYDHLLESCTSELRQQYQVIIEDKDLLDTHASKYIIKMHGDLANLQSIVLKEQDYLDFSQMKVLIELFVKALLTDHLILFLGYSLNDYNIKLIISWLNFMRQQNGALKGKTVGYIALDSEKLNIMQQKYFEQNSINVLNLQAMPLIGNIPNSLKYAEGRRLYSFLKVIEYPRLMKLFDWKEFLNDIVSKINDKAFIPYKELLKMIQIKYSQKIDNTLEVLYEDDFNCVKEICENNSLVCKSIKQHLINNGIYFISFWNQFKPNEPTKYYTLAEHEESTLFKSDKFIYYLENNYVILDNLINDDNEVSEQYFYRQFYCFYNEAILKGYNKIDFCVLSESDKLGYLYNKALIDAWEPNPYSLKTLMDFFNAIPSQEQKNMFSIYKETFDGFQDRIGLINDKLNKLIDLYSKSTSMSGNTLGSLFEIKNLAIELYKFHFYYKLFCVNRDDFKKVLKLYIEAILCTNGEHGETKTNFFGIKYELEKYALDFLDWDIITKYISTKELQLLLKKYHVKNISIKISKVYIIAAFRNLIASIDLASLSPYSSFWAAVTNYLTLLSYIEFSREEKNQIEEVLGKLLTNSKFLKYFFSINYPDFQYCISPLVYVSKSMVEKNHIDIVQNIVSVATFFDYFINVGSQSIRELFNILLAKFNEDKIQESLFNMINRESNFIYRNRLIWLFKGSITNKKYIEKLKEILEDNWRKLNSNMFIEFVFSDWIILNEEKTKYIYQEIIELDKKRSDSKIRSIPDPFDIKMDELCLFILFDKICDLTPLLQIKNKTPQLEFLLNPEAFDYSQVDFSDYMWENFARKKKYLTYFYKFKEQIVPKIEDRIEVGSATEFEKKMLYGVFMGQNELLNLFD